jgi:excisionase family DNA binding protein
MEAANQSPDGCLALQIAAGFSVLDAQDPPRPKGDLMTGATWSDMKFLTIYELAVMMRISKMSAYRLVRTGELEAIRVGRSYRIPEQAVISYMRDAAYTPASLASLKATERPPPLRDRRHQRERRGQRQGGGARRSRSGTATPGRRARRPGCPAAPVNAHDLGMRRWHRSASCCYHLRSADGAHDGEYFFYSEDFSGA